MKAKRIRIALIGSKEFRMLRISVREGTPEILCLSTYLGDGVQILPNFSKSTYSRAVNICL